MVLWLREVICWDLKDEKRRGNLGSFCAARGAVPLRLLATRVFDRFLCPHPLLSSPRFESLCSLVFLLQKNTLIMSNLDRKGSAQLILLGHTPISEEKWVEVGNLRKELRRNHEVCYFLVSSLAHSAAFLYNVEPSI